MKRPALDELISLWQSTIAAEGITTAPGAGAGNSIIDTGLIGIGANSFVSMLMVVYPGQLRLVDSMDITAFTDLTGEVTLSTAYKGVAAAIPAGVPYKILTFRFVPAEVAALTALVQALMLDVGDASTSVLGSIWNILGDPAVDLATQIAAIAAAIGAIDSRFQEQPDVAVTIDATAGGETNVFDLSVAATRYIVRNLRLKLADPVAETCTVRLYELVNDALIVVDTFLIDTDNFTTAHSLMDMWGTPHLAGDNLRVTVRMSGGPDVAVTGQYSWASAT